MGSTTPLLDLLSAHLPTAISSTELSSLSSPQSRSAVETLLSFALGADCPTRLLDARQEWSRSQPFALRALNDSLGTSKGSGKRARDSHHDTDTDDTSAKRQKTAQDDADDDPPLFTLPSISTTSPVRKKVDVTVHAHSIRFVNPGTRALESSVPLACISRAFLLPTRGKTKGHWTVVLLPTDIPDKAKVSPQQIIFGLDALSTAAFETTSYATTAPDSATTTVTVAKGEETATSVRRLLSHIPVPLLQPSATVFRSACATAKAGEGAAGIDAYLSAKQGTLWFFDAGILWGESKPCEFWAISDLATKDAVRLISATGRTCSVILSRRSGSSNGSGEASSNVVVAVDDEEEENIVETVFSMVDGKEQDPINAWARNRKHLFGKKLAAPSFGSSSLTRTPARSGKESSAGKHQRQTNGTAKGPAWDDSDPDDEDFEATSSEDLEHSGSDSEESEDGSGGENSGRSGGAEGSGEESDEEEEEEVEEIRHPLLRPGAMPRMSKAAIDTVVDMVRGDLGMDDASDEEDELEE